MVATWPASVCPLRCDTRGGRDRVSLLLARLFLPRAPADAPRVGCLVARTGPRRRGKVGRVASERARSAPSVWRPRGGQTWGTEAREFFFLDAPPESTVGSGQHPTEKSLGSFGNLGPIINGPKI